ncbi:MAG: hypothetical protein HOO86_13210 [Bacteroidales bacterium]|nr:hypothetical protein [Bacteroidales bacterium]
MNEPKHKTSVLIDGIFLQQAIDKVIEIYSELKPDRKFIKPELHSIIVNILDWYDKTKTIKKTINCHVWLSEAFNSESRFTIHPTKNSVKTATGNPVKVVIEKASLIAPELLDQLENQVNIGDVILVADDRIYEPALDALFTEGYTVTVIMLNECDGSEMITSFDWGDILYPLGMAMGINRDEL